MWSHKSKLAVYGPDGRNYRFIGMPFGPVNTPPFFISMMEDLSEYWTLLYKSLEVDQALGSYQVTTADCDIMNTAHFGTKVIVDDAFMYDNCVQYMLLLWRCILKVFLLHRASIKIKKCFIMLDALEFLCILLSREGNRPMQSKSPTYEALVRPANNSYLHYIKGMISWYSPLIDWYEVRNTA
jgi:hypothetical protein